MSAESLISQQDVHSGVGVKEALELLHLEQHEEINAFLSTRFATETSTRINSRENPPSGKFMQHLYLSLKKQLRENQRKR